MKKTTKKKTPKIVANEPNKVVFMTVVVAVLTLVALAGIATL